VFEGGCRVSREEGGSKLIEKKCANVKRGREVLAFWCCSAKKNGETRENYLRGRRKKRRKQSSYHTKGRKKKGS